MLPAQIHKTVSEPGIVIGVTDSKVSFIQDLGELWNCHEKPEPLVGISVGNDFPSISPGSYLASVLK